MTAAGQRQQVKNKKKLMRGGFDLPLFVLVMVILMLGLVMMFSASYADGYYNHHGDGFFYIKRQGLWAALGLVVMYVVSQFDYHRLRKFVLPVMVVTYLLLGVVLLTHPINGVRRWIDIGPVNIQPSEIAKFAVVLVFAHLIAKYANKQQNKMKTFKYGVLPFLLILGSVAAFMIKEPHLSGTILILSIGCVMMFVGGTRIRWFVLGISLAGGALLGMVLFTKIIVYAKNRLVYWIDPFKDPQHHGWQTIQSLYAIGSGGVMGLGLGNSRQKYLYVSEPQNDFVFPILCEELGLVGAVIVIVLFAMLVWRGYVVAMRAPDRFGALMVIGLTTQVGLQAILNIAVTTNTIPNTGISLPFFSYGGSSLLMLLFQMGVILSVSRYSSIEQT